MTQLSESQIRQMIAVANARNAEKIVEQYTDDATFQVPDIETPFRGKTAIRGFLAGSFAAFPDWTLDVSKVIVSGDETVVINSIRGTHTGPLVMSNGKTVPATNKKFVQEQVTRIVVNEQGKVTSLRSYGTSLSLPAQLGLSP
jgi:ketosteroid isomerase-like protein